MKSGNYDMVPTAKNRNSKRKYGLSQYDIEDYIASLEAENLYKGPEPELEPRMFSFNSPFGACPSCKGLGFKLKIDEDLIIPNVIFYTKLKYKNNQIKILSCHEDEN